MVEAFNAAKLDYATFGNHEFELPLDTLEARIAESELQVDLDQLRPGGRHPDSQGAAVGHAPGVGPQGGTVRPDAHRQLSESLPLHRSRQRGASRDRHPRGPRAPTWWSASRTRPSRPTGTCSSREPRLDLILGGHEHEWHDSVVSGRHVVKADANSRTAQFVTLWGGKGEWRQAVGLVKMDNRLPDDTAVAAVVDRWDDSLRARLGPERDLGHTSVPIDARDEVGRRKESMLGDLVADAMRAGTGADVAVLNAGTLRLDDVIRPGPLSNYQLESIFLFADETRVLTVPLTGRPAAGHPGARRRGRVAGQGRVPAGVRAVVHLRPRGAHGQADGRRRAPGGAARRSAPGTRPGGDPGLSGLRRRRRVRGPGSGLGLRRPRSGAPSRRPADQVRGGFAAGRGGRAAGGPDRSGRKHKSRLSDARRDRWP